MLYTLRFFSSKCSLFHNANLFGSPIIHILYTECAKIKKKSGAKGLRNWQKLVRIRFENIRYVTKILHYRLGKKMQPHDRTDS